MNSEIVQLVGLYQQVLVKLNAANKAVRLIKPSIDTLKSCVGGRQLPVKVPLEMWRTVISDKLNSLESAIEHSEVVLIADQLKELKTVDIPDQLKVVKGIFDSEEAMGSPVEYVIERKIIGELDILTILALRAQGISFELREADLQDLTDYLQRKAEERGDKRPVDIMVRDFSRSEGISLIHDFNPLIVLKPEIKINELNKKLQGKLLKINNILNSL